MAKSRVERTWESNLGDLPIFLVDVIADRQLSNHIESKWSIRHESPQLIVVEDGKAIYDASHISIDVRALSLSQ